MPIIRPRLGSAPAIEPAARVVDPYARPQAPANIPDAPRRTDLMYLADALGNLSPALANFGQSIYAKQQAEQDASALRLTQATTMRELDDRIRKGDIPPEVHMDALYQHHGAEMAKADFQDIVKRYYGENTSQDPSVNNAFDREGGNVDEFWKGAFLEKEKAVAPEARAAWYKFMNDAQGKLYSAHQGYFEERVKTKSMDAAHSQLYGVATDAISQGATDPVEIAEKMRGAFGTLRGLYQLTPPEADKALFGVAQAIADQGIPGNPQLGSKLVREILLSERGGLGSIGNKAEFAHKANALIAAADAKAGELQRALETETIVRFNSESIEGTLDADGFKTFVAANPHVLTQAQQEAILTRNEQALAAAREANAKAAEKLQLQAASDESQRSVSTALQTMGERGQIGAIAQPMTYLKADGSEGTIEPRALQDRAIEEHLKRSEEQTRQDIAKGMPEAAAQEGRLVRDIQFFGNNGLIQPEWKAILNGGFAAANPASLTQGQPPEILLQSVKLYEELKAKSPNLLRRHLGSDHASDFYNVYSTMKELARMDDRRALETAALATKGEFDAEAYAPSFKVVEEKLGDLTGSWNPFGEGVANLGDMRPDLGRLAKTLVKAGIEPTQALEQASKTLRDQYTNINGRMVKTSDRDLDAFPAALSAAGLQGRSFGDVVKDYLATYDPEDGIPEDLTIMRKSGGSGAWAVIDAATGYIIHSKNPLLPSSVSLQRLFAFEKGRQEAARASKAGTVAHEQKVNAAWQEKRERAFRNATGE